MSYRAFVFMAALAGLLGAIADTRAATITIVNLDAAGEGFNDATLVAPEGGNTGTTRGAQRLQLFQAAANVWAARLQSNITIKVGANFDPLTPCDTNGGVLGSAGPTDLYSAPSGLPRPNTLYVVAQVEAITAANQNGTGNELEARFNSSVDASCLGAGSRFWYGTDPAIPVPSNRVALFPVVLHEIAHGLGFISFVCVNPSGCGPADPHGSELGDLDDAWSFLTLDRGLGLRWSQMSDAQRADSMNNDPNLVWDGAAVNAALPSLQPGSTGTNGSGALRRLRLHAPATIQPGSSVSHWTNAAASPDLLMEPSLSTGVFNSVDMTVPLFQDIGWPLAGAPPNQPPVIARPASITITEDIASSITGISFADPDIGGGSLTATFSVGAGSFNSPGCVGVTSGGTATSRTLIGTLSNLNSCIGVGSFRYTTATDSTASLTMTVTANDNGNTGTGGAMTDTEMVTLNITAVNDAPVSTVPASIAVNEDVATGLTGISFADVDSGGGAITVTLSVSNGSIDSPVCAGVVVAGNATSRQLTGTLAQINACFGGANRPRFTTAPNATTNVQLTVSVSDNSNTGTGGTGNDSDALTLMVTAVNDAPSVTLPASIAILVPGTLPLRGIEVADVDSAAGNVTATLSVPIGTLSAITAGGVAVAGSGTATVVLSGNIASVAAFLASDAASYTADGNTTLTVSLNDQGNFGSGGPQAAVAMTPLVRDDLFANSFE